VIDPPVSRYYREELVPTMAKDPASRRTLIHRFLSLDKGNDSPASTLTTYEFDSLGGPGFAALQDSMAAKEPRQGTKTWTFELVHNV
jgi:hypothetical protein